MNSDVMLVYLILIDF